MSTTPNTDADNMLTHTATITPQQDSAEANKPTDVCACDVIDGSLNIAKKVMDQIAPNLSNND